MLSSQVPFRQNRFLHVLMAAMALVLAISAYHPTMVIDWVLENLLTVVLGIALTLSKAARITTQYISLLEHYV